MSEKCQPFYSVPFYSLPNELTKQVPALFIYEAQFWPSLCVEMSRYLAMLGHQQPYWSL